MEKQAKIDVRCSIFRCIKKHGKIGSVNLMDRIHGFLWLCPVFSSEYICCMFWGCVERSFLKIGNLSHTMFSAEIIEFSELFCILCLSSRLNLQGRQEINSMLEGQFFDGCDRGIYVKEEVI